MVVNSDNYRNQILIAEDEEGAAKYLAAMLEKANYSVDIVDNGQKAYDYIKALKEEIDRPIDLLITDVDMPVMGGMELLDSLKADHLSVPSIVVTASEEREVVLEALRKGCYEFIEKPLKEKDVLKRVDEVFRKLALERSKYPNIKGLLENEIPNYRLLEEIGSGTSGTVFLGERVDTKQKCAIKVLKIESFDAEIKEVYTKRFLNEGFAISQLSHPKIIDFIEFGFAGFGKNRVPYIVMEYYRGESLEDLLGRKELEVGEKIKIIRQVAEAISYIHSRNILHRDIKPGNILIDKKMKIKLTDFGLCRVPSSDLTMQFEVLGSPAFVAPEYWQQGRATKLVDIYSLGVLAYYVFLGITPFSGDSLQKIRRNIIVEYPKEPRKVDPRLPVELQEILAKALKKKAKYRYQKVEDLVSDLDLLEQGRFKGEAFSLLKKLLLRGRDWK